MPIGNSKSIDSKFPKNLKSRYGFRRRGCPTEAWKNVEFSNAVHAHAALHVQTYPLTPRCSHLFVWRTPFPIQLSYYTMFSTVYILDL